MERQNLFAGDWVDGETDDNGLRYRQFARPAGARMGATVWEYAPGGSGMRWHMHFGADEMFFVVSGRPLYRGPDGEEQLEPGDYVYCPDGRAGLHAFTNPTNEPVQILGMSAGSFPDVVAYPEHGYAWVATRDPDPGFDPGPDPGLIARFEIPTE